MSAVSIVVPCLNAEAFIAEAVESVRAQTCEDWEMLLIDDGSTDGTLSIMRSFASKDARIRHLSFGTNLGIAAARNIGTFKTEAPHLMHFDADDLLTPTALEEHLAVLATADVSYSGYTSFGEHSPCETVDNLLSSNDDEAIVSLVVEATDLSPWWRPPGAVMVRREADTKARKRFNVWDRRMPICGEMHYYACLHRDGARFGCTKTSSLFYRKHAQSDGSTANFFSLALGYTWMLDFWLNELGPVPTLIDRKARLYEAMRVASNVEAEFARAAL